LNEIVLIKRLLRLRLNTIDVEPFLQGHFFICDTNRSDDRVLDRHLVNGAGELILKDFDERIGFFKIHDR
jgi:hypothetical protein